VDERGVVHFTNVRPSDPRYRRQVITPRGIHPGQDLSARPPIHHGYDALILRAARAYQVQPGLVKAVIAAESKFDASAISRKGAQGLMQLMPGTASALGVDEPFEPVDNVLGGVRYLRSMLTRYGDVTRALAAYNAGPEAVDRYRGVPPFDETRDYVARVLDYYRRYDRDFRR
jgi:soluble lytic murein transglycosylase-like protein